MPKMSVQDLHNEIANYLGQISDLFASGMKLTFMARMAGNNEADVLISDDNEPEEMMAIVRRRFNLDDPAESVPIPTSVDVARLMLGLSYRYLQENAPENLAGTVATQQPAQSGSIDTPEFWSVLANHINNCDGGGADKDVLESRAALIAYIDGRTAGAAWIDLKDAKPDDWRRVLVALDTGTVVEGYRGSVGWSWADTDHPEDADANATHWMPWPKHPRNMVAAPSHQSPGKEG